MIRVILTQIVLFALPFVAFLVYRWATEGWAAALVASTGRVAFWLLIAGGLLVAGSFVYFAASGSEEAGVYVPAHLENGRLVPGGFRHD